jgi:hypothetical protein
MNERGILKMKYTVNYELRRERGFVGNEHFETPEEMVKWLMEVVKDIDVLSISKA